MQSRYEAKRGVRTRTQTFSRHPPLLFLGSLLVSKTDLLRSLDHPPHLFPYRYCCEIYRKKFVYYSCPSCMSLRLSVRPIPRSTRIMARCGRLRTSRSIHTGQNERPGDRSRAYSIVAARSASPSALSRWGMSQNTAKRTLICEGL